MGKVNPWELDGGQDQKGVLETMRASGHENQDGGQDQKGVLETVRANGHGNQDGGLETPVSSRL